MPATNQETPSKQEPPSKEGTPSVQGTSPHLVTPIQQANLSKQDTSSQQDTPSKSKRVLIQRSVLRAKLGNSLNQAAPSVQEPPSSQEVSSNPETPSKPENVIQPRPRSLSQSSTRLESGATLPPQNSPNLVTPIKPDSASNGGTPHKQPSYFIFNNNPPNPFQHTVYNDREADLLVKTTDGVLFRVHSYMLRAFSKFRMEIIGRPPNGRIPHPMDISADSHDFFTILQIHEKNGALPQSWDRIESALTTGVRLGFWMLPFLVIAIASKSGGYTQTNPWAVFDFASRANCLGLAKFAISHLHLDPAIRTWSAATFDPTRFSQVSGSYVAALYQAMGAKGWATVLDKESDWQEIACAFKV